jgi:hypothetical protein
LPKLSPAFRRPELVMSYSRGVSEYAESVGLWQKTQL